MQKDCKSLHFIGVGGIGMSALAQMSASSGFHTTGSDRAISSPENIRIFDALRAQNVGLYPQDGSVYKSCTPDALVYSTAIEEDNPDFLNAPAGIPRLHRSAALKMLVESCKTENMIAVTGTCGKTSVTAQLAEALYHAGAAPGVLCGGLVNAFVSDTLAGNYCAGEGRVFVVEADESDKSLLNYTADTAVVLNIGTDHYPKEVLVEVFRQFICNTRKNIVLSDDVLESVGADACAGKNVIVFSSQSAGPEKIHGFPVVYLNSYRVGTDGVFCSLDGLPEIPLRAPGRHNALNAAAVYATLRLLGYPKETANTATGAFSGVWRRFDFAGKTEKGVSVYDDYAHNVEKILSCFEAAKSISTGRVFLIFQPHGFKPFEFMRETLFTELQKKLRKDDVFALLPVYYAGGTTSFSPTSAEVAAEFRSRSGTPDRYPDFADRTAAENYLRNVPCAGETVIVMGARDNSLSIWSKKIAENT